MNQRDELKAMDRLDQLVKSSNQLGGAMDQLASGQFQSLEVSERVAAIGAEQLRSLEGFSGQLESVEDSIYFMEESLGQGFAEQNEILRGSNAIGLAQLSELGTQTDLSYEHSELLRDANELLDEHSELLRDANGLLDEQNELIATGNSIATDQLAELSAQTELLDQQGELFRNANGLLAHQNEWLAHQAELLSGISEMLKSPEDTRALEMKRRGMTAFRRGHHEEAYAEFINSAESNRYDYTCHFLAGLIALRTLHDPAASARELGFAAKYALPVSKRDAYIALMSLARAELARGADDEAVLATARAIELDPGRPAGVYIQARTLVEVGREAEAGPLLLALLRRNPSLSRTFAGDRVLRTQLELLERVMTTVRAELDAEILLEREAQSKREAERKKRMAIEAREREARRSAAQEELRVAEEARLAEAARLEADERERVAREARRDEEGRARIAEALAREAEERAAEERAAGLERERLLPKLPTLEDDYRELSDLVSIMNELRSRSIAVGPGSTLSAYGRALDEVRSSREGPAAEFNAAFTRATVSRRDAITSLGTMLGDCEPFFAKRLVDQAKDRDFKIDCERGARGAWLLLDPGLRKRQTKSRIIAEEAVEHTTRIVAEVATLRKRFDALRNSIDA